MRTLRVIQGVGGHQLLEIQQKLQSWWTGAQRPLNDTKNLREDQLHVNWEKIFQILYDLWKRKMCTKLVTLSHRWAQWSAFWWITLFWKSVTHLIHSTLSQPTLFSWVESALKEIWFQDAAGHQVICNLQIKCISFRCY
jgi:hypothetical protein